MEQGIWGQIVFSVCRAWWVFDIATVSKWHWKTFHSVVIVLHALARQDAKGCDNRQQSISASYLERNLNIFLFQSFFFLNRCLLKTARICSCLEPEWQMKPTCRLPGHKYELQPRDGCMMPRQHTDRLHTWRAEISGKGSLITECLGLWENIVWLVGRPWWRFQRQSQAGIT